MERRRGGSRKIDNPGASARFVRRAGFAPARLGWRPRLLLLHQRRDRNRNIEQVAGIEPSDPSLAASCVTTTLHLRRCALAREPPDDHHARSEEEDSFRAGGRIVGRVGIEPTSGRIKNPLQSQRLLPTQYRPTPWNRTRTSRFSAKRADHMRQSGSSGCLRHAGTHVVHLFGCHRTHEY